MSWVIPIILEGKFLKLEPLGLEHIASFQEHYSADLYAWMSGYPASNSFEDMKIYFDSILTDLTRCNYAINIDGQIAGRTGYMDIREKHKTLEIGTVIFKPYQGTNVNPESKYLLFKHAFETLEAVRVQIKTDSRNAQSQRAIEKLGAVKEGILRNYQTRTDGYVRDTVMYSVIDKEWPSVRAGLEARLYTHEK
ncbi:MAG: GNAT family N-acetyltransferase [Trueperaceae bacterium]